MGVGEGGDVAVGVCAPALCYVACVAVDFFVVLLLVIHMRILTSRSVDVQFTTTRAGDGLSDVRRWKAVVFSKSTTGP